MSAFTLRSFIILACKPAFGGEVMLAGKVNMPRGCCYCISKLFIAQRGFTYLIVLIAIALMGATVALTGTVWHTEITREKESELLYIGGEFRKAIRLYYQAGGQYPKHLEDLLKDPRLPNTTRYLRKLYLDPINGKKDWGLVRGPDGGIIAVYSLSQDAPIKTSGFTLADKDFEGKVKYSEWLFVGLPMVQGR